MSSLKELKNKKILNLFLICLSGLFATATPLHASENSDFTQLQVRCQILNKVNAYRQAQGKSCLGRNFALNQAAQRYAIWFGKNLGKGSTYSFGHNADGRSPVERAKLAGYTPYSKPPRKIVQKVQQADGTIVTKTTTYSGLTQDSVGENILYFQGPSKCSPETFAERAFEGWKHSKPHHYNIVWHSWNASGVGFYFDAASKTCYGVQMFGMTGQNEPKMTKQTIVEKCARETPLTPENLKTCAQGLGVNYDQLTTGTTEAQCQMDCNFK